MVSNITKSLEMDLDINSVLSAMSYQMNEAQNNTLKNNNINNSDIENFLKKESCYIQPFEKDEIKDVYISKNGIQISCKSTTYRNYEYHQEQWKVFIPDYLIEAYEKYGKEIFDWQNDDAKVTYKVYEALLKDYIEKLFFEKITEYKNILIAERNEKQKQKKDQEKIKDEEDKLLYEKLKLRFEGSKWNEKWHL